MCLFAQMVQIPIIPLFSMTGILWITSFIEGGAVKDDAEAKQIYKHASVIAMVIALLFLPICAQLSDRVSPLRMLPLSFLCRSLVNGSFMFVRRPNSWVTPALFGALLVASEAQGLIIASWYFRKMNKEVRGNMTNLMSIFSTAGQVLFVAATGKAFDIYGPSAPFSLLAILDLLVCLLAGILAVLGILKE